MVKKPLILLDMDGVCSDFIAGVADIFDKDREEVYNHPAWSMEDGYNRMSDVFGISEHQIWSMIERRGVSFWSNLPQFPWFKDMYEQLNEIGNVVFLSQPSLDPFCCAGKMRWLQGIFGKQFRNYIFSPLKPLFRQGNSILIDDNEDNCKAFGTSFLFPQPWNKHRYMKSSATGDVIRTVISILEINKENNNE